MRAAQRLAILFSGSGSTMAEVIRACHYGLLVGLIDPVVAIASKAGIGGLDLARLDGVPSIVCGRKQFDSPANFGEGLLAILRHHRVDIVLQAGWTCTTPANVFGVYHDRVYNQHPGMLDHGYLGYGGSGMVGLAVHWARYLFLLKTNPPESEWFTEVVCHRATPRLDDGAVIWSARVPVYRDDTAETLQARALPVEWAVQIAAMHAVGTDSVQPIVYHSRIIKPGQEEILESCKREAIARYPFHP